MAALVQVENNENMVRVDFGDLEKVINGLFAQAEQASLNKIHSAYKTVYEDMINSGCGLLVGKYDAKHGNKHYMSGICSVMEWIAEKAGQLNEFNKMFTSNLTKSEKTADFSTVK